MTNDPQLVVRRLVEDSFELVSLPELYFQVDDMISDSRYTAEDIGSVISTDPAMTARLLKIVNSAFYGLPGKIDTLSRAITIVGMDELRTLVLAASAVDKFNQIPNDLADMGDYWLHSIHCGVSARLLAKKSGVLHNERLFIAGLLHELGTLLIYNKLPAQSREILSASQGDKRLIAGLERELLGFTHADVSAEIMDKWGLPDSLVESTRWHLSPESSTSFPLESHLLYMANLLSGVNEQGDPIQDALAEIPELTWSVTRLAEAAVLEVLEEVPDHMSELFGLLIPVSQGFH